MKKLIFTLSFLTLFWVKAHANVVIDAQGNPVDQVVIDTTTATDEAAAIQQRKSTAYVDNGDGTFTKSQTLTKNEVKDKIDALNNSINDWKNIVQIYNALIPDYQNKINKAQADKAILKSWLQTAP